MAPKLIFLDLDGTVVGSNHAISDRVLQTLARCRAAGARVAIATGRPYFSAKTFAEALGANAPSMFFSGSYVIDPTNGEEHLVVPLEPDLLERYVQLGRENGWHSELYTRTDYILEAHTPFVDVHLEYLKHEPLYREFDELGDETLLKGVFMVGASERQTAIEKCNETLGDASIGVSYGARHQDVTFFNISSGAGDRARAFSTITNILDIDPADVAAFGDAEADITFIKLAGTGVAMGNASAEVQAAANRVAPSVENDGVAVVLEELFGLA